jgi:ABC-type dipeptide/oligopeptide/nickel transport system ATPase component
MSEALLSIRDLAVSFPARDGSSGGAKGGADSARNQAVDGNSLTIFPAQTLAVVGESGCGKSVSALTTLGLLPTSRVDRGSIQFRTRSGRVVDLLTLKGNDLRAIRGNEVAMIFQEPMTSLNPVFTVGEQIMEAILLHQSVDKRGARAAALDAMRSVGIKDADRRIDQYPHQFSGGMRQRVMIAMALACNPSLLLADEPTTALDVTIQAQILQLLRDLKRSRGMAIMLITHDLGVVAENADVVAVMYAGRVVEYASVHTIFQNPLHPYTRALLACIPKLGERRERLTTIREIIDDEREFTRLAAAHPQSPFPLRPWWPTHTPPVGSGGGVLLHEVESEHWVSIWGSPGAAVSRPPAISVCANSRVDGLASVPTSYA